MSQQLHTFARLQLMFHPVNEKFQYTRRKQHTSEQTKEHNINTQLDLRVAAVQKHDPT